MNKIYISCGGTCCDVYFYFIKMIRTFWSLSDPGWTDAAVENRAGELRGSLAGEESRDRSDRPDRPLAAFDFSSFGISKSGG